MALLCLEISHDANGSLHISSTEGMMFNQPVIQYIWSIMNQSRPDLWVEREEGVNDDKNINIEMAVQPKGRKITGLTKSERSIVHLLDNDIICSLQEEMGEEIFNEENDTHQEEIDYKKELLKLVLKHDDATSLNDVIANLRELSEVKWKNLTPDKLYPSILTNPSDICKKFMALEIIQIGNMLEQRTSCKFCKSNATKPMNSNKIAQAFIGKGFLEILNKKKRKNMCTPSPESCKTSIIKQRLQNCPVANFFG